jgi:hypothetical protein
MVYQNVEREDPIELFMVKRKGIRHCLPAYFEYFMGMAVITALNEFYR